MVIGFGFLSRCIIGADYDPPDAYIAHVVQAGGQCEDGHQLARRDVESSLSYGAICFVSQDQRSRYARFGHSMSTTRFHVTE